MKKMKTMKLNGLGFYKPNLKWNLITFLLLFTIINVQANVNENTSNFEEIIQDHTITGTITDNNGQPLPGANIIEKGTTTGAQTDFDGNFSLTVSDQNATLVVSYLGFVTKEVAVNGQTTLSISLEEDAAQLDEVVVVGYGALKKSHITGSVASVPAEDLQALPVARVDQALQGRISGVNIQNNDAAPNSSTSIRIRGANSINGGNDPLVVIDGFQGGSINTIHPNDIKSIEVLKDASATAIYGSRGSNGVILVTTKSGKNQKAAVSYNTYVSIHNVREKLDLLSPLQYAETVNANRLEFGQSPVFSSSDLSSFAAGAGTDWQDAIFRTAVAQNHNLSVSGGGDKFSYFVAGDILDKEGIVEGSGYDRFSLRTNLDIDINEKLKLTSNVFLAREKDQTAALNSFAGDNGGSPIFSAIVFAPTLPVFDDNGNYTLPAGSYGPPTNYNPVALAKEPLRDNISNTSSINLGLDYEILEGLKVNITAGYRLIDRENSEFLNSKPTGGASLNSASIVNSRLVTLQNTNLIRAKAL